MTPVRPAARLVPRCGDDSFFGAGVIVGLDVVRAIIADGEQTGAVT
jgi:hypothetical protein